MMESTYRQVVVLQIILLPVLILLEVFFPVPEEISYHPYFEGIFMNISDGSLIFMLIVALAIVLANWVACFLIYFYKKIGRSIYSWTLVIGILAYLLGPSASTALSAMLDALSCILAGATIVFMYYTSIKDKFEN